VADDRIRDVVQREAARARMAAQELERLVHVDPALGGHHASGLFDQDAGLERLVELADRAIQGG
jgi:hypothetical protein